LETKSKQFFYSLPGTIFLHCVRNQSIPLTLQQSHRTATTLPAKMKLDPTVMRTMDKKDFRVLEAVEKGMQNHGLVPEALVATLANLRHGGTGKIISTLLRDKLLSHESKKGGYDGYRITNAGYDILALHNLKTRGFVAALGDRIGTGKESDVYLAVSKEGRQVVLKMHRLGRTSFRNVRKKRDYFNSKALHAQPNSWLFLSRLSAIKEFAFMKALLGVGYPTPIPEAHNRHIVVMSLVRGVPLYQIIPNRISPDQAQSIFLQATRMATRLVQHGLVHCDLNEFNLLVDMSGIQSSLVKQEGDDVYVRHSGMSVAPSRGALSGIGPWDKQYSVVGGDDALIGDKDDEDDIPQPIEVLENGEPKPIVTLIDFPQMISTQHPNAKELYERDLECLRKFFVTKLQCQIPEADMNNIMEWEALVGVEEDAIHNDKNDEIGATGGTPSNQKLSERLDVELKASGYSAEDSQRDLELFYFQNNDKLIQSTFLEEDEEEDSDYYEEDESGEEVRCDNAGPEPTDIADVNENDRAASQSVEEEQQKKPVSSDAMEEPGMELASDDEKKEGERSSESENLIDTNPIDENERRQLHQKAKARVRKQMEEEKKKGKKKGAFRSRNSNKSYAKGKRVMQDFGL